MKIRYVPKLAAWERFFSRVFSGEVFFASVASAVRFEIGFLFSKKNCSCRQNGLVVQNTGRQYGKWSASRERRGKRAFAAVVRAWIAPLVSLVFVEADTAWKSNDFYSRSKKRQA